MTQPEITQEQEARQWHVGQIEVGMLTSVRDHFTDPEGNWVEPEDVVKHLNALQHDADLMGRMRDALRVLVERQGAGCIAACDRYEWTDETDPVTGRNLGNYKDLGAEHCSCGHEAAHALLFEAAERQS